MTMKATLNQLRNAVGMGQNVGPLTILTADGDLRIRTKNRLEPLWEKVLAELERAEKNRNAVIQRLALKDDKTDEVLHHPNGAAQFQNRATRELCEEEIAELYADEVELPGEMFQWDDFRTRPNAETLKVINLLDDLSAAQYVALRWFVHPREITPEDEADDAPGASGRSSAPHDNVLDLGEQSKADNEVLDLGEKADSATG